MRDALARTRPDVVHVHNTWFTASPAVVRAAAAAGVPVVITVHNFRLVCLNAQLIRGGSPCEDCVGRTPWPGVLHRCYRGSAVASIAAASTLTLHRRIGSWDVVDRFLVLNRFAAGILARGGVPAERIAVRPNAVADPGPRAVPPSRSTSVVFVGRLVPEKGVADLLDAWSAARPDGLELVVVGDGPLRAELEARRVPGTRFTGWIPAADVAELLRSARALVLPTRGYEGQPLAVLEALAAGCPVLVSGLGGLPELLAGGDAGESLPPTDRDAWAAALARLRDGERVDAQGAAARRRYEAAHTPAAALASLVGHYEELVASGGRASASDRAT
jgi:glycosyltransferase involved in cell wall biosynthesis